MNISRRSLLGFIACAPAIVQAASLDCLAVLRPAKPVIVPSIASMIFDGIGFQFELTDGSLIGPIPAPLVPGCQKLVIGAAGWELVADRELRCLQAEKSSWTS